MFTSNLFLKSSLLSDYDGYGCWKKEDTLDGQSAEIVGREKDVV